MRHKGTVRLETKRLILRRFTLEDSKQMYNNWANDDDVTKYLTWPTHKSEEVSRYILNEWVGEYTSLKYYQWCIELKETGEAIGSIGAVDYNEATSAVEIGYCIGKRYWNKGYTSEAFSAVIDFFFNQIGLNRVEARHDPNNRVSGLVMKKCGLKYEGTRVQADKNNTGVCDTAMYGLINPNRKNTI